MPECREGGSAGAASAKELSGRFHQKSSGEDSSLLEYSGPCCGMQQAERDEPLKVAEPWEQSCISEVYLH